MVPRTVSDRLREEYSNLLPEINRVLHYLKTNIAYLLLDAALALKHHERIRIEARVKECESAIDSLRRREEARQFDEDTPGSYSLTNLPDLAALRILVFPRQRLDEVHKIVRERYADWTCDPVTTGDPPKRRAWKYYGFCPINSRVKAEIQVVPMLTGLFWQVEHDYFYKPRDAVLRGAIKKPIIRDRTEAVYNALEALEDILERELRRYAEQGGP